MKAKRKYFAPDIEQVGVFPEGLFADSPNTQNMLFGNPFSGSPDEVDW